MSFCSDTAGRSTISISKRRKSIKISDDRTDSEEKAKSRVTMKKKPAVTTTVMELGIKSSHGKGAVDEIICLVHGVEPGDIDARTEEFRKAMNVMNREWFWEIEFTYHIISIDWKCIIQDVEQQILKRFADRRLTSSSMATDAPLHAHLYEQQHASSLIKRARNASADMLFFMTPALGDRIVAAVARQLNTLIRRLRRTRPERFSKSRVTLIGHSLGGIILYELLSGLKLRPATTVESPGESFEIPRSRTMVEGKSRNRFKRATTISLTEPTRLPPSIAPVQTEDVGPVHNTPVVVSGLTKCKELVAGLQRLQRPIWIPPLEFDVANLFLWGCPTAAFLAVNYPSVLSNGTLRLPLNMRCYNIYHPADPVALRLEPILYSAINDLPPAIELPYWRNNGKRWHVKFNKNVQTMQKAVADTVNEIATNMTNKVNEALSLLVKQASTAEGTSTMKATLGSSAEKTDSNGNASDSSTLKEPEATRGHSQPYGTNRLPGDCLLPAIANIKYGNHGCRPLGEFVTATTIPRRSNTARASIIDDLNKQYPMEVSSDRHVKKRQQQTRKCRIGQRFYSTRRVQLTRNDQTEDVGNKDKAELLEETERILGEVPEVAKKSDPPSDDDKTDYDDISVCGSEDSEEATSSERLEARLDFVLQEETSEFYVHHLGVVQSHTKYWSSRDIALFTLKQLTNRSPRLSYEAYCEKLRAKHLMKRETLKSKKNYNDSNMSDFASTWMTKLQTLVNEPQQKGE